MIRMEMKYLFFDSKAVCSAVDRGTRKVLSRFGAFVRQAARRSIRKRKRPSPPGQPPSSHTGLLKRFIWFAYEPESRSVVIGPVRLSQNGRGEAPQLLEHGGTCSITQHGKRKRARYHARPFMGPAMEQEQPRLPALWRDSIK